MSIISKLYNTTKEWFKNKTPQIITKGNRNIVAGRDINYFEDVKTQIDYSRQLLDSLKPDSALEYLQSLKERIWNKSTTTYIDKFRILANIASAKFQMNKHKEAAKYFIEAFQYNRASEKAKTNLAFAYLILNEKELSAKYANEVLQTNPLNVEANSIIIDINPTGKNLTEILNNLMDILKEEGQVCSSLGMFAYNNNDFGSAVFWLSKAIDNNQKEGGYKALLGNLYLQEVIKIGLSIGNNELKREYSEKAFKLLNEALLLIKGTEIYKYRFEWVLHRGTASNFLNNLDDALNDFKEYLEVEPKDAVVINNLTLLYMERNELDCAIELLSNSTNIPNFDHQPILLSEIYRMKGNFESAERVLREFISNSANPKLLLEAKKLLAINLQQLEKIELANELIEQIRNEKPNDVITLVNYAETLSKQNKANEAIGILKDIFLNKTDENSVQEISILANSLHHHNCYKEAASLFEELSRGDETILDNPVNRKLLDCYLKIKDYAKGLNLCQSMRTNNLNNRNLLEIEAYIYEKQGDIGSAKNIFEEYLNNNEDLVAELHLASLNLRSGKTEDLNTFLSKTHDISTLDSDYCIQLAQLFLVTGKIHHLLNVLYETRRKFYNLEKVHEAYVWMILEIKNMPNEITNICEILEDTYVELKKGDKSRHYILESRQDIDLGKNEISKSNPIGKKLYGKKINDTINFGEEEINNDIWLVSEIKSKYLHAFNESMDKYNELFDGKAFKKIILDPNESPYKILEYMTKDDKERTESINQLLNLYKAGKITIGMISELTNYDIFELFANFTHDKEIGFKFSAGDEIETRQGLMSLNKNKPIVIDLLAINTLNLLEVEMDKIDNVEKFLVTQSTIDEINNILFKRRSFTSSGYNSIVKQGETFVRFEITKEEIQNNINYLEKLKEWVEKHCTITTIHAEFLTQLSKYDENNQPQIGKSFLESIFIAKQEDAHFYTDDYGLRMLAKGEFMVDGVWTQSFLQHLLYQKKIDPTYYNNLQIKLLVNNYKYVRFDYSTVLLATKKDNWLPSFEFQKILSILYSDETNQQSMIAITSEVIFSLWQQVTISNEKRESLLLSMLNNLLIKKNSLNILKQLNFVLEIKFRLLPISLNQVKSIIAKWYSSNFFNDN